MSVFADTSAFLAVQNIKDENNRLATHIWDRLIDEDLPIFVTNYVLVESLSLIQRRQGMNSVSNFQNAVIPLLEIVWVDAELHQAAQQVFLKESRRSLSLVDCVSFEVIRRLQITDVFAFDRHFIEHGFHCLIA